MKCVLLLVSFLFSVSSFALPGLSVDFYIHGSDGPEWAQGGPQQLCGAQMGSTFCVFSCPPGTYCQQNGNQASCNNTLNPAETWVECMATPAGCTGCWSR